MGICVSTKKIKTDCAVDHLARIDIGDLMPMIWSTDKEGGTSTLASTNESVDFQFVELYRDSFDKETWAAFLKATGFRGTLPSYRIVLSMNSFLAENIRSRVGKYGRILDNYYSVRTFNARLGERIMCRLFDTPFRKGDYSVRIDEAGTISNPLLTGETLQRVREQIVPATGVIDPFDYAPDRKAAFQMRLAKWFMDRLLSIDGAFFDAVLEELDKELDLLVKNEAIKRQVAVWQASIVNIDTELERLGFNDQ